MASNAFEDKELVTFQGKSYPVVGGRLRLAHDEGLDGIETEIVEFQPREKAFVHARVFLAGKEHSFDGYGYADKTRDVKGKKDFTDALLELAETRAIARALRFAGFGVEYTGAEEMSHVEGHEKTAAPGSTPAPKASKENAPTPKQMGYLRSLKADLEKKTGEPVSLETPRSAEEASRVIDQLKDALQDAPDYTTPGEVPS